MCMASPNAFMSSKALDEAAVTEDSAIMAARSCEDLMAGGVEADT